MNRAAHRLVIPGYRAGVWTVDPSRSTLTFGIRQIAARTRGRLTGYDVEIVTGSDPLESSVAATMDLASLDTGNAKRDKHLRGPEYLAVEEHPTATYRSTGLRRGETGLVADGILTLRGIAHPVPLAVTAYRFADDSATFTAEARLRRRDFGINVPMDGGGIVIADKVSIRLEIHARRQS